MKKEDIVIEKELKEFLKKEGVLSLFVDNIIKQDTSLLKTTSKIAAAFLWHITPEDVLFWYKLHTKFEFNHKNKNHEKI